MWDIKTNFLLSLSLVGIGVLGMFLYPGTVLYYILLFLGVVSGIVFWRSEVSRREKDT